MLYHLATVTLAPVLVAQGTYVRKVTPRLPEPEGARAGVWGSGPALRLLILGDSAAAGVGVDSQAQALSGRVVAALGEFHRVHWKLLADTGHDSSDVVKRLDEAQPEVFDVAVLSVGVNDVTGRTPVKRWLTNLAAITRLLAEKFQVRRILFSSVPPMHHFPALPQPLRWWLGRRAVTLNSHARSISARHARWEFVDVAFPLESGFMASDGFHPGEPAYALWGQHLAGLIRDDAARLL